MNIPSIRTFGKAAVVGVALTLEATACAPENQETVDSPINQETVDSPVGACDAEKMNKTFQIVGDAVGKILDPIDAVIRDPATGVFMQCDGSVIIKNTQDGDVMCNVAGDNASLKTVNCDISLFPADGGTPIIGELAASKHHISIKYGEPIDNTYRRSDIELRTYEGKCIFTQTICDHDNSAFKDIVCIPPPKGVCTTDLPVEYCEKLIDSAIATATKEAIAIKAIVKLLPNSGLSPTSGCQ